MSPRVYLDHAASCPTDPRVVEVTRSWMSAANPAAVHRSGQKAAAALATARQDIAQLLGVETDQLIFTSGGTEANNLGLWGKLQDGGRVVVSPTEHPSVLRTLEELEKRGSVELDWLSLSKTGLVSLQEISTKLRTPTRLLVVQAANSETGLLQPVKQIGALAEAAKVDYFCDAIQGIAGALESPIKPGVSLLSLSGHKFGGPKGVGLLYCAKPESLRPMLFGGDQEYGLRSGTQNLPGIMGLAAALNLWAQERETNSAHYRQLQEHLYLAMEPMGSPVLPQGTDTAPQITSFFFPPHQAGRLLMRLDLAGFEVSSGSACALGKDEPSPVLLAMGVEPKLAQSVLRFSFGPQTSLTELDRLSANLSEILGDR